MHLLNRWHNLHATPPRPPAAAPPLPPQLDKSFSATGLPSPEGEAVGTAASADGKNGLEGESEPPPEGDEVVVVSGGGSATADAARGEDSKAAGAPTAEEGKE